MDISPWAFYMDKICAAILVGGAVYCLWKKRQHFQVKMVLITFLSFLFLFSAIRCFLFFLFRDFFLSLNTWEVLKAFLCGIRYDLCALAVCGGVFMLAFLIPVKNRIYYQFLASICVIVWTIATAICVGDLIYFSFVKRHTGSEILLAMYDADLLTSLASSEYMWIVIVLFVIMIFAILLVFHKTGQWYQTPARMQWQSIVCFVLVTLSIFFAFRGRLGFRFKPLTVSDAYADGHLQRANLELNGLFCMYKSLSKKYTPLQLNITSKEAMTRTRKLLYSPQEKYLYSKYPLLRARQKFNAQGKNFNVVIILVESWQYHYTDGIAGTHYGATPVLDKLAKESLVFDRFYASGQRSINGAGAIMSGVAQLQGLPYFSLGLESYRFTGLARLLRDNGYRTVFAQPSDWNSARIGLVAQITGFEEIYSRPDMRSLTDYIRPDTISDYDGLMFLADKLKNSEKPFFAFFFTSAMHPPFLPLHQNFEHFPWNGKEKGYLNALNYTDWAIGEFMARLKTQGQYDNTVFFILADHTLGWGEEGSFDDRFHIPFLLHAPALFKQSHVKIPGAQTDILPTVLDILNISTPYAAMGNSLLDKQTQHFAFTSEDGRILGLVTDHSVLEHTGQVRATTNQMSEFVFEDEQNLLSLNRAVYDMLTQSCWAP